MQGAKERIIRQQEDETCYDGDRNPLNPSQTPMAHI